LSSLAKAIILQAETEVTAEVRTAEPLSKVTVNLLGHLEDFSTILYARIVQRVGGWAVPIVVPTVDFDGRPWQDKEERLKVMGYRKGASGEETETTSEYCTRIAGIMRIYFYILKIRPPRGPLWPVFQTPRCWVWFARIVGEQHRALLESPAAAYLIHSESIANVPG
jgi:nucleoporin GLE1